MEIHIMKNYEESCSFVANIFLSLLKEKPGATLGLATGSTPIGIYQNLIKAYENKEVDFSSASSINLDEYIGLEATHEQSYHYFMQENLFKYINMPQENIYVPSGIGDISKEISRFMLTLESKRQDIQLLGVGPTGHVGFNEANDILHSEPHVETLSKETIEANSRFFEAKEDVPTSAITMGMKGIMQARKVILVATGKSKAKVVKELIEGDNVSTQNPSTFLKLHPNALVVIDDELMNEINSL